MSNFILVKQIKSITSLDSHVERINATLASLGGSHIERLNTAFKSTLNEKLMAMKLPREKNGFYVEEEIVLNKNTIASIKPLMNILSKELIYNWVNVSQEIYHHFVELYAEGNAIDFVAQFTHSFSTINININNNTNTEESYYFIKLPVVKISLTDNSSIFVVDDFYDLLTQLEIELPNVDEID
jgi:hypothetical protein